MKKKERNAKSKYLLIDQSYLCEDHKILIQTKCGGTWLRQELDRIEVSPSYTVRMSQIVKIKFKSDFNLL